MCPDCKDTGVYVGLNATEPCKTCGGKKAEAEPQATYEQASDGHWRSVTITANPWCINAYLP